MSFRPRRVVQSAVNTPTTVHVNSSSIITKSEAESILSEFISTSESIATTIPGASNDEVTFSTTGLSNNTGSNAILSQLKRVQRDLRGLPPLLADFGTEAKRADEEPVNKKIKFDDDDAEVEEPANKRIKFDEEETVEEEPVNKKTTFEDEDEPIAYEAASEPEEEVEQPVEAETSPKKEKKEKKHKKEKKEKKHKKEKKSKSD